MDYERLIYDLFRQKDLNFYVSNRLKDSKIYDLYRLKDLQIFDLYRRKNFLNKIIYQERDWKDYYSNIIQQYQEVDQLNVSTLMDLDSEFRPHGYLLLLLFLVILIIKNYPYSLRSIKNKKRSILTYSLHFVYYHFLNKKKLLN